MIERGLRGVRLVVGDRCAGLVSTVFCQLGVCRLTVGKLTGLPVVMLPVCRGSVCPVGGFLGYCMRAWVLR